jgi:hypothetical protein
MPSDPANILDRPIVVVGAPRSGTTLMGELLSVHPSLAHVDEPRLTWRYGNDAKSDMLRPEDARPEVCQLIRQRFAATVRQEGKQRLIEKTPSNSLRMEFVERVLPGCLFVHIIRDGVESSLAIRRFWQQHARGVKPNKLWERLREIDPRQLPYYGREFVRRVMPKPLAGLVKQPVWGPRIPGIDSLLKELELIEVCALQWRTCVEAACHYGRTLPADRYMECRLEELSPALLKSVLDFCQLEPSPEVEATFARDFDAGQTRHRRAAASAEDIELIHKWTETTLKWLGYDS